MFWSVLCAPRSDERRLMHKAASLNAILMTFADVMHVAAFWHKFPVYLQASGLFTKLEEGKVFSKIEKLLPLGSLHPDRTSNTVHCMTQFDEATFLVCSMNAGSCFIEVASIRTLVAMDGRACLSYHVSWLHDKIGLSESQQLASSSAPAFF